MKITVLGSGSKGNSTLIDFGDIRLLLDVGFSYKQIKERLSKINIDPHEIDALLITHDHDDHTYGLKVFLKNVKADLFITKEVEESILDHKYDKSIYLLDEMIYKGILIKPIPLSHDSITINGFLIEKDNESLVYITDTGYINRRYITYLKNKTYYIIESNHDTEMLRKGPYPEHLQKRILSDTGHLSNDLCAGYLSQLIGPNTKKVLLAHLSESNNTKDLALSTNLNILKENDISFNSIECASQDEITKVTI